MSVQLLSNIEVTVITVGVMYSADQVLLPHFYANS